MTTQRSHPSGTDLTRVRFGRWLVLWADDDTVDELFPRPQSHTYKRWLCRCDCGYFNMVAESALVFGKSRSCMRCSRRGDKLPENTLQPLQEMVIGLLNKYAEQEIANAMD